VVLSSFLIIHRLIQESEVDISGGETESNKEDRMVKDGMVRIVNIKGPFFFGSTSYILEKVDKMFNVENVVLDCSLVSFMDLSAIYALSESIEKLKSSGIEVYIVADEKRKEKLIKLGIGEVIDIEKIVESQIRALRRIKEKEITAHI
jgi:SulP family sulfate permease